MTLSRAVLAATLLLSIGAIDPTTLAGDSGAAQRQYRIARRLAAEASPDAAEALQTVVKLDPTGPLADDALVEQALLEGLPRWPEELGNITAAACGRALKLLGQVVEGLPAADRLVEARYYRALLQLEPLPTFDGSETRIALITVATDLQVSEWTRAARYTGAWLAANTRRGERAESAFGRLLVDAPGTPAATRAAVGLARLRMRTGDHAGAARLLDQAARQDADPELHAAALRELAVRLVLHGNGTAASPRATTVVASTGVKALVALAVTADGVLVADGRSGTILQFAADGRVVATWTVPQVSAVAVDGSGRIYTADHERVYRLRSGRSPAPFASVGEYGPPSALAVEVTGQIWLLDRKGETVAGIAPGRTEPEPYWTSRGQRLSALTLDGSRLLAIDSRERDVVWIDPVDGLRTEGVPGLERPLALAVDAAGRIAVLDGKDSTILLHASGRQDWIRISCKAAGIARPTAIGFGEDGALQVFDESSGGWVRIR